MTGTEHGGFLSQFLPAQPVLRAYLHAATRDVNETDELLQQVAQVLWEKFDQYDASRPFAAWAIGFARVQVMRWRQRQARARKLLSEQALEQVADAALRLASEAEADARPAMLEACLQRLQPRARSVVEMKYRGGLAIKQIAERLAMQVGAIEMTLVRARRALRDCIERKLRQAGEPLP